MLLVGGLLVASPWITKDVMASGNPFADVQKEHWSYEAIETLYEDGVIEGYGDNTFRGDQSISRYEMARLVAKAIAKENENEKDISAKSKTMIDRLSAEYAEELELLGVRVDNLEKHADKVKWEGSLRYTYSHEKSKGLGKSFSRNYMNLILKPSMEVNQNWNVHARLDGNTNLKTDRGYGEFWNDGNDFVKLKQAYAEGKYGNFNIKMGKIPFHEGSRVILDTRDDSYSGASTSYKSGRVDLNLGAGRWGGDNAGYIRFHNVGFKDTANYQYADVSYRTENDKGKVGVGFHHLNSDEFKKINFHKNKPTDEANIWLLNGEYKFNKDISVQGSFAKNISVDDNNKSMHIEIVYRGANSIEKGSYGAYVAYRYLGYGTTFASSFDAVKENQRGFEIGGSYSPFNNVIAVISYFRGNDISSDKKDSRVDNFFGRIYFYF